MFNFPGHCKELNNWLNESTKDTYLTTFRELIREHPKLTISEFYESEMALQIQEIRILENIGSLEFDQIAILNKRKKLVRFYEMLGKRSNAHLIILLKNAGK